MRFAAWFMAILAIAFLLAAYLSSRLHDEYGLGSALVLPLSIIGVAALLVAIGVLVWLRRDRDPNDPPRAA
jgi:hypothetical protein